MIVEIQALDPKLSQEELRKMIPAEKLQSLSGKGILQAYIVAQEGTSRPRVLGETNQILRWPRAVIRRIKEVLKVGTKFFINHGKDNSHEGRREIGEALVSEIKEISGNLSTIVIGHFPDKDAVKDMDVCSMEADINVSRDDQSLVNDIENISAIALGSSRETSPAFAGAQRLATIQCFGDQNQHDDQSSRKEIPVTFEEVRKAVKEMNIFPMQLFTIEEIKSDRKLAPIFEENEKLKLQVESGKRELEDVKKKSEESIKSSQKTTAKVRLKELLPEGLTKKQTDFIMESFDPETLQDLGDDGLKSYIGEAQKEFTRVAKLFNVDESGSSDGGERKDETSSDDKKKDPVEAAMDELLAKAQ